MILQEVFAPVNEVKPLSKDQMDAMDKAREQDDFVLPELEKPEPGFFDGMGEASWKGVASSALKSASALDTALSSTGMVRAALNNAQIETGYTFDDLDKRQSEIENRLDQDSKELRRRARDDFGIDPTTMGTAAQIIYGVAETIPKAIGYSLLAGPAGGSVLFGADLGISRSQELMDEGVDKNTAINAGLVTFGTAALGMRLPATFGRSRIASATIGAAANAGLTAAEMQGVNWVLQNQNYKELSQKYQLNGIDLATSAIFGGVMGGVLWRPGMNPSRPQTAKERSVPLQERIKRQLREASPDTISDEAIETQAVVQATGIQVMADRAQIDADAIAPEIVRGDSSVGQGSVLNQVDFAPGMMRLYHGGRGGDNLTVLDNEGVYDGVFASSDMDAASSHGDNVYYTDIDEADVLTQRDLSYNIDSDEAEQALRKAYPAYDSLTDAEKEIVWDSVIEDNANAHWDELTQILGYEDAGEASWEAQRIRGHVARELGYKAVEMNDEHGTSYLVLPGNTLSRVPEGGFNQRAWHGSPHIFDTFSTEHIGTGEGAQAHGWGLYFAENKKVADAYRSRLSDSKHVIGRVFEDLENSEVDVFSYMDNDEFDIFLREIDGNKFSDKTTEFLKALNDDGWLGFDRPTQAIREALSGDLSRYEHGERLDSAVKNLASEGRVFEVDIPDESEMLDENLLWGAGHNFELKQKIKDMIRDWNITNPDNPIYKYPDNPTGKDIYKAVAEVVGGPKAASLWFNERGIKGITYDGLRDGRCYVVFDDKAIQTIDFYQRQNSQTTAEQKLRKDVVAWNKLIDELEAVPKQTVLMLNQTPLVMHMVGADFKKLYATPHMFERLFKSKDGSKGSFGKNELKQIPQALTDPIAIFDQDNGRKLFLLDLQTSNGSPVVVPVEFNAQKDFATVNLALTAFAKEKNGKPKFGWIKNLKGKELYVNTKKLTSLNTSAGADSLGVLSERSIKDGADNSSVTKNVLTEDDLVKEREKYPGMYQGVRGSFNPALNRITLTANANISTYSHEMGHWYLENLFQLSRRAVAENTLKEDANILLKEFGIKSVDDWDNLGIDGQRKYQEQFASWVEIYLSEGRAPKPTLQRVFERLGQWLVDLYRELGGVKKAVGDTYKAEVGEELPPVSDEVAKVLDRLFANDRAVRKASRVSKSQVAAARMVQANRTNNNKLEEIVAMPNGKEKTRALRDLEKSTKAQLKAIQAMKRGLPVDVSQDVEHMNVDVDHLVEMKGNFGRAYVMGNTDSAVVLQNRDRSDVGSIGQMNAIAANPQYGLVSVSRSYSGAPVVSYGSVPDSAHLGNNDFIVETNGNRVPFMYAVVEASDVETSNFIDGSTNTGYGNPQRMNAVVGNGRMTALKEAYNRGTANQYRTDLEADTAHGIKPEVIQKMKNPVLVRVINPEDVTTGFISRSNGQQVLALDDVEVAREDAPKIRARAGQYEFDEAGNPTNDTLALFIQDLHDPNALGRLITSDGRPTPEAVRRIRNAVFFEAYQSPELSALFSQEVDPGIRRILNGLANVAPRIIELREQAQELDFSNLLVEAANRIRQARLNPEEGADFASQMSFLDNPATSAFVEFLDDNANSAAAIARTLNPLIDWAENAAQAADGGLFGGDAEVHVDLADVVGQLRNIINDQRAGAGLEPLPEIDVNALRDQIQTTVDTVAQAVDEVNARIEAETRQAEVDIANESQALDAQRQQSLAVLDEKSSVDARAQFLMEQNPDQVYRVLDENGMEVQGTLNDLLAQADDEVRQAEIEAAGIGRAVECVLRNGGI